MITSYKWRGIELNDGIKYSFPNSNLDDRPSADSTFAYRRKLAPVKTGIVVKESQISLVMNIHGNATQFETNLGDLYRLFNTDDESDYKLERKKPTEQYYNYIWAHPVSFAVDRTNRKITITLKTAELKWKSAQPESWDETLFTVDTSEEFEIENTGYSYVEPIIKITPTQASTDGQIYKYWRFVDVWVHDWLDVSDKPVQIVSGWDISALVGDDKIRDDGLDISVLYPNGASADRLVVIDPSATDEISVWIKPRNFVPHHGAYLVGSRSNPSVGDPLNGIALDDTDTTAMLLVDSTETTPLPSAGTFKAGAEIISYTGATVHAANTGMGKLWKLTGLTRGVGASSPQNHQQYARVMRSTTLKITHGYNVGAGGVFPNNTNGWPLLNYTDSTNSVWSQTAQASPKYRSSFGSQGYYNEWFGANGMTGRARPGEVLRFSPTGDDTEVETTVQLQGFYDTSITDARVSGIDRMAVELPNSRTVDYVRLQLTLDTGGATSADIRLSIFATYSGFGTQNEVSEQIGYITWNGITEDGTIKVYHKGNIVSSTPITNSTVADTGFMQLNVAQAPVTHISVVMTNVPPTTSTVVFVKLDEFELKFDQFYGGYSPIYGDLGTENGIDTDSYPIYIVITNEDDAEAEPFIILFNKTSADTEFTIDCYERTVSANGVDYEEGMERFNLLSISYQNEWWLRLLPGDNNLTFETEAGQGEVDIEISWSNIY